MVTPPLLFRAEPRTRPKLGKILECVGKIRAKLQLFVLYFFFPMALGVCYCS